MKSAAGLDVLGMNVPSFDEKPPDEFAAPALRTWGRGRAVRLGAHDYASDVPIHLVLAAHAATPFSDGATAARVTAALERSAVHCGFRLYAYCLMPNHLHVLVSPADSRTELAVWLRRFKSFSTREFQKHTGNPRLWQYSALDRVQRPGEPTDVLVAYIANNPVRAGLVARWDEWPHTRVFCDDGAGASDAASSLDADVQRNGAAETSDSEVRRYEEMKRRTP